MKLSKTLSLVLVVFLVVSTLPMVAASDECGFFCSIGELLWGSSENRAGKSWFDRDNLVGMAAEGTEEEVEEDLPAEPESNEPIDVFKRYLAGGEDAPDDEEVNQILKNKYHLDSTEIQHYTREIVKGAIAELIGEGADLDDSKVIGERLNLNRQRNTFAIESDYYVNLAEQYGVNLKGKREYEARVIIETRELAIRNLAEGNSLDNAQRKQLVEMGVMEQEGDSQVLIPGVHSLPTGQTVHVTEEENGDIKHSVEPPRSRTAQSDDEWSGELPDREDAVWNHNGYWEYEGVKLYEDGRITNLNTDLKEADPTLTEGIKDARLICKDGSCHLYDNKEMNAWTIKEGKVGGTDWEHSGTWIQKWQRCNDNTPACGFKQAMGGNTKFSAGMRKAQTVMNSLNGWRGLSHLAFGDEDWYNGWVSTLDEAFAKAMGTEIITREACKYDSRKRDKQDGQSSVFIVTSPGVYQFVGSIQAEKTNTKTYLTCTGEEYNVCPEGLTCKDSVCYDNKNQPVKAYQYKISWGVTAPQDVRKTPYIDENGKSLKFNILLTDGKDCSSEGKYLYNRPRSKDKEVIELSNGASDKDLIVDYSLIDYDTACVCFSNKYYSQDRRGSNVKQICASIAKVKQTKVIYDMETPEATTTTSSSSTVGRTDIW
jgi:hypothetical protein